MIISPARVATFNTIGLKQLQNLMDKLTKYSIKHENSPVSQLFNIYYAEFYSDVIPNYLTESLADIHSSITS